MKSLSGPISAALGAAVQRPALLIEFAFSPILRWSSAGTISYSGHTWTSADIAVESLRVEPFRVTGTLVVGNTDGVFGALCIADGVQDRAIRIWGFDAAATGSSDFVWLADAVAGAARIGPRDVRLQLRHRAELIMAPRTVVNSAAGFTQRLPAGAVLRINGIDYRLERPT